MYVDMCSATCVHVQVVASWQALHRMSERRKMEKKMRREDIDTHDDWYPTNAYARTGRTGGTGRTL